MPSHFAKLDYLDPSNLSGNPRATLRAYLRMEPIILAAHAMHPKTYVYAPSNLAAATLATKLRDAIRGAIVFDYPAISDRCVEEQITKDSILAWYQQTMVRHDNTQVLIGPYVAPTPSTIRGVGKSESSTALSFESLTLEEILAFTLLLSHSRVPGPIIVHNPPDLSVLPARENVEVIERADGSVLFI